MFPCSRLTGGPASTLCGCGQSRSWLSGRAGKPLYKKPQYTVVLWSKIKQSRCHDRGGKTDKKPLRLRPKFTGVSAGPSQTEEKTEQPAGLVSATDRTRSRRWEVTTVWTGWGARLRGAVALEDAGGVRGLPVLNLFTSSIRKLEHRKNNCLFME